MKRLILALAIAAPLFAAAQQTSRNPDGTPLAPGQIAFEDAYKRTYHITRTDGSTPTLDGRLDEPFWQNQGELSELFVQVIPYERMPTPYETRAKLLYDDRYIYVALWAKDIHPETINRFIGNRDANNVGDLMSMAFDPYHDFRAAPEFNLNVGGNKTDLVVTDAREANRSWNAVWDARTHVSEADSMWTAEIRIPFSQLRYNRESADGVWGLHIRRIIRSVNQTQNWSLIPLKNSGHVYSFGELDGMTDLPRPRGFELLPYAMGKVLREPRIAGSPYQKGTNWFGTGGLDGKVALNDFTLDFTINPDFGQVEVDPSVMNLTAYETFYEEQRPFFLEGKHILDVGLDRNDIMFHTRRIGSQPAWSPGGIDNVNSFADYQENVPILAAVKLTGTNKRGLTIGAVQSLTPRQLVAVSTREDGAGQLTEERVASNPFTNYSIVRVLKKWGGDTQLGGMVTSVNRALDKDAHLKNMMAGNAFTGSVDFLHYFRDRTYYVDFKGMFSSLHGSREAITRLQSNSVHYYQRASGQDYLGIDENRTSLSGSGGYVEFGRRGSHKWHFSEKVSWATPGFDLNDVGYLRQADMLTNETNVTFRQTDPGRWFRSHTVVFDQENTWDFGGRAVENGIGVDWSGMTNSRLSLGLNGEFVWNRVDNRLLRGGPDMRLSPYFESGASFSTDRGRRLVFDIDYQNEYSTDKINRTHSVTPGVTMRIGDRISLSADFNTEWNRDNMQYVGRYLVDEGNPIYVMALLNQRTYSLTMRLQANLTPDLSIQFYGSPFTSTGRYTDFKRATNTLSRNYNERFETLSDPEEGLDNFSNPDFSFNEFRSNLVVRWEYRPGSTVYFVWEHQMSERAAMILGGWGGNLDRMWGLPARNTFMVKLNYWINW